MEPRCQQHQDRPSGKLSPEPGLVLLAHWHQQHTAWCKLGFPAADFPFPDGSSLLSRASNCAANITGVNLPNRSMWTVSRSLVAAAPMTRQNCKHNGRPIQPGAGATKICRCTKACFDPQTENHRGGACLMPEGTVFADSEPESASWAR